MGYRDKVLQQVGSDHPINKGVKMQAHHLISRKALLDSSIENRLEDFKYDIDNVDNIALIPCTLQGACHLNVQLHRGNHPGVLRVDNGNNDDDSEHPDTYHDKIKKG
ncbi:AHH domain-containing protein [Gammaproteobacteria bacterium AS21]